MPEGGVRLTEKQAATRVAMFFENVRPHARPGFPNDKALTTVKVRASEFRQLVDRESYTARFHEALRKELCAYSLLLAWADDYVLVIGWQDPAVVPVESQEDFVHAVVNMTQRWNAGDYAAAWEKDWP